jgi:hypothetical protein
MYCSIDAYNQKSLFPARLYRPIVLHFGCFFGNAGYEITTLLLRDAYKLFSGQVSLLFLVSDIEQ